MIANTSACTHKKIGKSPPNNLVSLVSKISLVGRTIWEEAFCQKYIVARVYLAPLWSRERLALLPTLFCFYLLFVLTIIHGSGRPAKSLGAFITWMTSGGCRGGGAQMLIQRTRLSIWTGTQYTYKLMCNCMSWKFWSSKYFSLAWEPQLWTIKLITAS